MSKLKSLVPVVIVGLVLFFMFHKWDLPEQRVKTSNVYTRFITEKFGVYGLTLKEEMHTSTTDYYYYMVDYNSFHSEEYVKEKEKLKELGWRYIGIISEREIFCDKKNNSLSFKFPDENAHQDDLYRKNWGVVLVKSIGGDTECKLSK